MDIKRALLEQIEIVIKKLEMEYVDEIKSGVMKLIYIRYMNAVDILKNNKDINKINIIEFSFPIPFIGINQLAKNYSI